MTQKARWSTDDFEEMSWHDAHVHGFQIIQNEGDNGTAELVFDIDYILEWHKGDGAFNFVVAQARLQFHQASDLTLALDYVKRSAGMCAFAINGIERERIVFVNGNTSYKWKIEVNWPSGSIEFLSRSFTQVVIGQPIAQQNQSLAPSLRSLLGAA